MTIETCHDRPMTRHEATQTLYCEACGRSVAWTDTVDQQAHPAAWAHPLRQLDRELKNL